MWNRIVVTDQNRGVYGALVHDHLRKRRLLFHEKLGWDIPRSAHIEQDQYDRAETVYILVERGGLVEGYARLLPTLARVSYGSVEFRYMMRDATLGLLPGIPPSILGARPAPRQAGRPMFAGRTIAGRPHRLGLWSSNPCARRRRRWPAPCCSRCRPEPPQGRRRASAYRPEPTLPSNRPHPPFRSDDRRGRSR